ncbi:MAG: hypothetical protein KBF66_13500 [Rhodoferax sp.]|uniref:hypothetical protein n=1 Tax=Rhodoferax sp. TaxID=50421 RepID=UPI001B7BBEA9|nr:hypothetical protein [Rhodoferax sp.]MBP9906571.1 hypothetical protein [Rhodoferax sp.]
MSTPTWLQLSESWDRQRAAAAEQKIREEEMARRRKEWEFQDKQNAAIDTERAAAIAAASRPLADANSPQGFKAGLGLEVPQSAAAMRRGDERFKYGEADVYTPEAPGAQPQFALDQQANTISALNMAGRDPRQIADARRADTTNRLAADAARISSYVQTADEAELKDLMGKVTLDKRNKFEVDYNPATGFSRVKHGDVSVDLSRADLGKFVAAQYRMKNGDYSASADIEGIDSKLSKVVTDSLKESVEISKDNNSAIRTQNTDIRLERAQDLSAARFARSGINAGKPKPLTAVQQRGNFEIDAAREAVQGMDAADIRRRTAKTTDTGRENPDYDPGLAKAAALATRRKIGDDQTFDNRQIGRDTQAAPATAVSATAAPASASAAPTLDRQELGKRFRSDRQMNAYRLGSETPKGYEVLDASGKVVGHYR